MNKLVLITGASHGIGASTAIYFAKKGYDVVINYNKSKDDANKLKEMLISSYNVKSVTVKADVSCEDEVKKMINFVIKEFGKIDVLVNNAGISLDSDIKDKKVEDFKKVLEVNLIGTFLVSREVLEIMKEQGFGNVINVSSNNALDCYYPESIDYDCSKAGIVSLTHNLAKYYAPIRVNCICPGWVKTDMNKNLDSIFYEQEVKKILLKRFAEKEEIAETIYFLANATYINDAIIRVDGGING